MIGLRGLHEQLRPYAEYALKVAQHYGINPELTSTYRSLDQQRRLYDNWQRCKAGQGPTPGMSCSWPANPPGASAHNYGLAWDSWVPDHQMARWVEIRRWVGWRVPDRDVIHAELPGWTNYVGGTQR